MTRPLTGSERRALDRIVASVAPATPDLDALAALLAAATPDRLTAELDIFEDAEIEAVVSDAGVNFLARFETGLSNPSGSTDPKWEEADVSTGMAQARLVAAAVNALPALIAAARREAALREGRPKRGVETLLYDVTEAAGAMLEVEEFSSANERRLIRAVSAARGYFMSTDGPLDADPVRLAEAAQAAIRLIEETPFAHPNLTNAQVVLGDALRALLHDNAGAAARAALPAEGTE